MSRIPTKARRLVRERDDDTCQRCFGYGTDWHHRRRRNAKNGHYQHCNCIGVILCRPCHNLVHANPKRAMETGFIISSYEEKPWTVPLRLPNGDWQTNDCEGGFSLARNPEVP